VDNDVIFCALEQGLPQRIPWVPGVPEATLVLVDRGRVELDLKLVRNCASHGVLHLPATARHIHTTLLMAREHYEYECRLRGRIDKLDESLRGVRTVERAKSILISDRNLNEEAAYDFMRQRAMEKRVPIVAIATLIVDTHELLD
ncbi:ANTAR domain-containing response regulator, partial [Phaeobacter gallaeciensis]